MAPTSCFNGQVHRLPDSPEAYGAMITHPKAAPAQSRSTDRDSGLGLFADPSKAHGTRCTGAEEYGLCSVLCCGFNHDGFAADLYQ